MSKKGNSKLALSGTFNRPALLSALRAVAPVVEKHSTIPILSTVLLEAAGDVMKLRGTNLDIEITTECDAQAPRGKAAIPHRLLMHFLDAMEDDEVTVLTGDSGRISVKSGGISTELTPMSPNDFPLSLACKTGNTVFHTALAAGQLAGLMFAPRHVMCTEETRYYLQGLYFEIDEDGRLRATATDGHRLISRATGLALKVKAKPVGILPATTVEILAKCNADREVQATFFQTRAEFVIGDKLIVRSKLIDASYPNWRQIVPKPVHKERVTVRDLMRALSLCHFGDEKRVIFGKLQKDGAPLRLSVIRSQIEDGEFTAFSEIPARGSPRDYAFGLNASYLKDMCKALGSDEITLGLIDARKPILIEANNGSIPPDIAVLMPMKI